MWNHGQLRAQDLLENRKQPSVLVGHGQNVSVRWSCRVGLRATALGPTTGNSLARDLNCLPIRSPAQGCFLLQGGFFRSQVETTCKINYAENLFRQSQPLPDYIVRPVKNKQSSEMAVEWFNSGFNRHTNPKTDVCHSTALKQDSPTKSDENISSSDSKGLPSVDQLEHVYNRLGEDVSNH